MGSIYINPQQFAQQAAAVLGVAIGVAGQATVALGDIEIAIRAKLERAAIVVDVGLVVGQQHLGAGGIGAVGVVGNSIFNQERIPIRAPVGVVDEEAAIFRIVWVKGQSQQPLLERIIPHQRVNIEEGRG